MRWCVFLALILALGGVVTAVVTLASIVSDYCADPWDPRFTCDGGMPNTISYMSRVEPLRSRLAAGMTVALLLLVPADLCVLGVLSTRVVGECYTVTLAALDIAATCFGVASVNQDPASKAHVRLGMAYVVLRLVYSLSLAAHAFPLEHRPGVLLDVEAACAWARVLASLATLVLGMVILVQAMNDTSTGEVQLAALVAVASFIFTCYDIALLGECAPAARRSRRWGALSQSHGQELGLRPPHDPNRAACKRAPHVV